MDYLTILTTRSLLLFPSPSSISPPNDPSSSPYSSNSTTPTSSLPSPQPIAIPLCNLLSPDTQLFFFLHQHVIGRLPHGKEETREAEVMVWRELDKAGTFLRELGMAAGRDGELKERALEIMAGTCGLVLCSPKAQEDGDVGRESGRGGKRGAATATTVRRERMEDYGTHTRDGSVIMA